MNTQVKKVNNNKKGGRDRKIKHFHAFTLKKNIDFSKDGSFIPLKRI